MEGEVGLDPLHTSGVLSGIHLSNGSRVWDG